MMRFGKWYPLADAEREAPAVPGVFQVRVASGLVHYTRGKSAMIHYAATPDLRAATGAFAAQHPAKNWLCRHCAEFSVTSRETPEEYCTRLRDRFVTQFGSPPRPPRQPLLRSLKLRVVIAHAGMMFTDGRTADIDGEPSDREALTLCDVVIAAPALGA